MPRTAQEIIDHQNKLADEFEALFAQGVEMQDATSLRGLITAAKERAAAEQHVLDAVSAARADGISWKLIGGVLGTSGEAARQRYSESIRT